eukprot:SAG31_NODE_3286_length_4460_cov_2.970649_1_plen_50_part_00
MEDLEPQGARANPAVDRAAAYWCPRYGYSCLTDRYGVIRLSRSKSSGRG